MEGTSVGHPTQGTPYLRGLLNVHVSIHTLKSLVKIKWSEFWLCSTKILWVIHPVVGLVLMFVEIGYRPADLVTERLPLIISSHLLMLIIDIHPLYILFECSQRISIVEYFVECINLLPDGIMLGLLNQWYDAAIHDNFLKNRLIHWFFKLFRHHRLHELRIYIVSLIEPLEMPLIIENVQGHQTLLIV